MNIKKILIILFFTSQFTTTIINANQAAWNQAFLTFGGGTQDLAKAANYISLNDGSGSWSSNQTTAKEIGNTPEALAVGMYMSKGKSRDLKNKFTGYAPEADLLVALEAAKTGGAGGTVDTVDTEDQQAKDDAAAALKKEIESAEVTYNSYLEDPNKASLSTKGTDLENQIKTAKTVYNSYLTDSGQTALLYKV